MTHRRNACLRLSGDHPWSQEESGETGFSTEPCEPPFPSSCDYRTDTGNSSLLAEHVVGSSLPTSASTHGTSCQEDTVLAGCFQAVTNRRVMKRSISASSASGGWPFGTLDGFDTNDPPGLEDESSKLRSCEAKVCANFRRIILNRNMTIALYGS